MSNPTFRATSRVLLIDPSGAALMFLQYGKDRDIPPRWITPGGGVDPGENHDEAALREVFEETGAALDSLPAPFVEQDFAPDQRWHPYETGHWAWYDVRVDRFDPVRDGWTEEELADVVEWRWMTADDMVTESHEVEPAELPRMLSARLAPVFTAGEVAAQPRLELESFSNDDGVDLGMLAVEVIRERRLNLAVRVTRGDDIVFQAKLKRTGLRNDEWLVGKVAVVTQFAEPSLLVKLRHLESGTVFGDRTDVDHSVAKAAGGSLPIWVHGELAGTITMSGEPDSVDHATAQAAAERYLAYRSQPATSSPHTQEPT